MISSHDPHDVTHRLVDWAELREAVRWEALFTTMALFGRLAAEVATDLGYSYPRTLEQQVTAYARSITQVERGGDSPD